MENDMNCQTMLLQMDAWLDKELSPEQERTLLAHTRVCAVCAAELAYAAALHQQVTQLPLMDCPPLDMASLERMKGMAGKADAERETRGWQLPGVLAGVASRAASRIASRIASRAGSYPGGVVAFGLVLALGFGFVIGRMGEPTSAPAELAQDAEGATYTQEEIVQAIEDIEVAISYLQEVSERTSTLVERQLLDPVRAPIHATSPENETPNANGPI